MPEAGALHAAYTAHATDILAITARLPAQIAAVSRNLHSTAQLYTVLESTMAQDIGNCSAPAPDRTAAPQA